MNRFKNLAIAFFVSPEILLALGVFAFVTLSPESAANLGNAIRSESEIWKYLPALTFIFAGAAINYSFKLRAPLENSSNKALYQWPLYHLLVDRVYIGLFYGISSAAASFILWIIGQQLSPHHVALVFLIATTVSGTTALTMLLAQQKLRELLDKYT
nr:hypothetical protein [Pseudomonas chengduensis]